MMISIIKCSFYKNLVIILFSLVFCVSTLFSCANNNGEKKSSKEENITYPKEVIKTLDKKLVVVKKYENVFSGEFGDWHEKMIHSGSARGYKDFKKHTEIVKDVMEKVGAKYGYVLFSTKPYEDFYEITVDASEPQDSFGSRYAFYEFFATAMKGTTCYDTAAFDDTLSNAKLWSYAIPIRDSKGKVVAIAGFDFDFDFVTKYPELIQHN